MSAKLDWLYELITPAVAALGYELWGIEYMPQGKRSLLRIYIDSPSGITVDDCAQVSHQVSGVLDVEDPIRGEYVLEVSSPGLDRPLFKLAQYEQNIGQEVSLRLQMAFEGRRKYRGILTGVEGDEIVIVVDEHEYLFPLDSIEKAHIVARLDSGKTEN